MKLILTIAIILVGIATIRSAEARCVWTGRIWSCPPQFYADHRDRVRDYQDLLDRREFARRNAYRP